MRRFIGILCALVLTLSAALMAAAPVGAVSASISVSGPSTVRAGNTITLAVNMSGSGLYAVQGALNYDTGVLTYAGYSGTPSGWSFTVSGGGGTVSFLGYDDNQTKPIKGGTTIFYVAFTVSGSAPAGTAVRVTPSGVTASDGTADASASSSGYSVTVAAPLSSNCDLASLSLSGASISPAFSAGTTWYAATVPFSTDSVSVSASTADGGASYTVSGNNWLAVGTNYVYVTVTAANGAQKTYTVAVTRQQDPDYVPSDDAALAELSVSVGMLSPAFDPEITEYALYLPFEADVLSVSAKARDALAEGAEDIDGLELEVGETRVEVRSVAEDGETEKLYYINVWRMPRFTGPTESTTEETTTEPPETTTEPPETTTEPPETTTEPTTEATTPPETTAEPTTEATTPPPETTAGTAAGRTGADGLLSCSFPLWMLIAAGILGILVGFGVCFAVAGRRKND